MLEKTFRFKNSKVSYFIEGRGKTILLLHGFLENKHMWKEFIDFFKTKYRVIAVDLLGHGSTECIGYIHTMEDMAKSVKQLLDHLKIRKITIFGHSMGGYVGLAFAEEYPDNVRGIALINSTSRADSEEKKKNRNHTIQMVKDNHKSFVRISIPMLFRSKNRKKYASEIAFLKEEALKTSKQGIIAALEGMKVRKDREVLLHFGPYKKMLIFGEKDPVLDYQEMINESDVQEMFTSIYPDGHMSWIENKEDLLRDMQLFLKKI